jgi:O-antigen/teichoic acid export membrane protein
MTREGRAGPPTAAPAAVGPPASDAAATGATRRYGRGARVLSVGIALTGIVTFAYFSLASYALDDDSYARISLLWSVMFVVASVIYRPVEQLLSRTIAQRRAQGVEHSHPLRVPALIQAGFALLFLLAALVARPRLEDDLFGGSATLYWILVVGVLAYAASYFARGWLAGHERFELYGGLVLLESVSRCLFALAAVIGVTSGQNAVAMGMAAAPFVSLCVVPWALRAQRRAADTRSAGRARRTADLTFAHGAGFAAAVLAVQLAEQTLINAAPLTVNATAADAALAGVVFNVLLIVRAPLQLFQSVQTSLLPHLTGLHTTAEDDADFRRAIRVTCLAIAGFAGLVALGLLLIGPWVMGIVFDVSGDYGRVGLAVVGLGMGLHLIAGTLTQAALARAEAVPVAIAWLVSAALFVAWMLSGIVDDELVRAEAGYAGAALLLCTMLAVLYRRPASVRADLADEAIGVEEPVL